MENLNLNERQKAFCEEYIISLNATKSAKLAGYSEHTAGIQGFDLLRNPKIRAYIDQKLEELSLGRNETLKAISDIAKASLNDYFKVKEVVTRPKVQMTLLEVNGKLTAEIEDLEKLIERFPMSDSQKDGYLSLIEAKKLEQTQNEITLERYPDATVLVDGEPVLTKVADIDMVKLVEDKAGGRIKSIAYTEFGPKIELYAADAALRDIARVHGLFEKDNSQLKADNMSDERFAAMLDAVRGK